MGLLETLIARVTKLELQAGIVAEVVAAETVYPAAPAAPALTTPAAPVVTDAEALVNEHGIVWNAELHASTKTTNQDGHWKAKKGVDKALIEAYNAKFVAADTAPAAPVVTTPPAPPAAPSLQTPPAPPSLVTPPAPPAAPALPAVTTEQTDAVKYIQQLTNDWNVPYTIVVTSLIAPHGADRFDNVDPKHHAQIRDEAFAWLELLTDIDADIERLDAAGSATGNVVSSSVMTLLQSHGGSQKLQEIPREKLAAVSANLKPFADQWVAYAQSQGKM